MLSYGIHPNYRADVKPKHQKTSLCVVICCRTRENYCRRLWTAPAKYSITRQDRPSNISSPHGLSGQSEMRTGLLGSPLVAVPIANVTLIVGKSFCVLVNIDAQPGARRGAMLERKTSQRRLWLQVTQVYALRPRHEALNASSNSQ